MVEGFFSKMIRQMLRGIRVKSKEELTDRINRYFAEINEEPIVFHWKYNLDDWAGDLLQMGGVLQNTLNFGGYNYFTPEDLQTIIGAPANGLQNYHLYGKDGKEMSIKDGGLVRLICYRMLMPIKFQGYIIGRYQALCRLRRLL